MMARRNDWVRDAASGALLLAVYVLVGKAGLRLAYLNPSATPVWAPTGVALAAFLLLGLRFWPVILAGAFIVNVTTAGSPLTAAVIALGNTAEGLLGASLAQRYAGGRHAFERARSVFYFIALAAIGATTVSATVGVTVLALASYAPWSDYGGVWLTWWLGDAVGAMIVAPVIILWWNHHRVRWTPRQMAELALLVLMLVLAGSLVFGGITLPADRRYPLEFLAMPLFMWAAFRFGSREAATGVLLFSAIAVWGTLHGHGPFQQPTLNESLVLLQAFSGITAATTLGLSADIEQRRQVESQLRDLAVHDPLTGLWNYRHFVTTLGNEIARAERTERPFALVLMDLDELKKINDAHGHLTGSRVLCRLAAVVQDSCRAMDTAARYGGDEFVIILPEAGEDVARQVARRVQEEIATDPEAPPFTVSVGVAVYPRDGETAERVVTVADRALYVAKARRP